MKANNIMKQSSTILILALALSLGFSACSKDKEPEPKEEKVTLEGKWVGTDVAVKYYYDETLIKTKTAKVAGTNGAWQYVTIAPKEIIIKMIGEEDIIELPITVNETTIIADMDGYSKNFEYLISGKKLTITTSLVQNGSIEGSDYNRVKSILNFVKEE